MADLGLPSFGSYMDNPPAPPGYDGSSGSAAPSGGGNVLTQGFMSGLHGSLGEIGSAGEAVGRAIGADHFADEAAAYSQAQQQAAQKYARPDVEGMDWYDPRALTYRLAQSLPMIGAGLVGAAATPEALGGAVVGGALAALPSSIGANVQQREQYTGQPIDQSGAMEAIGLGLPEAAVQGFMPAAAEKRILAKAFGPTFVGSVAKTGLVQAGASAATEWATQQMGDPNRTFAQRAQDVVSAALQGGMLGGVTGGVLHPLTAAHEISKTPAQDVSVDDLNKVIGESLQTPQPIAQPIAAPGDVAKAQTAAAQELVGPPAAQDFFAAQRAARPVTRAPGDLASRMANLPDGSGVPAGGNVVPTPDTGPVFAEGRPAAPQPFGEATSPPPPIVPGTENYDWAADRALLQKNKAYGTIFKGPFASRAELLDTIEQNVGYRLANGDAFEDLPKPLQNAARLFNVVDDNGNLSSRAQATADAAARPPGVTPDDDGAAPLSGPQVPDRLAREEIKLKQQGRWDQLEEVRQKLLGDNLSDPSVMSLLQRTADAQNSLNTPNKNWRGQANLINALRAETDARTSTAKATPAPAAAASAPAVTPDPTPAAQATIAKATASKTAPPPVTREAAAKAARRGVAPQPSAPAPEPTPAAPEPPATMRDKVAANEEAPAPPATTPEEMQAVQPNDTFAPPARTPEEQDAFDQLNASQRPIERDARYWQWLRNAYPEDIEARAQQAENLDEQTRQLSQPAAKDDATRQTLLNSVDQARQAGAVQDVLNPEPVTREARARAARQAMLEQREPPAPVAMDDQHTPEVVRPRLARSIEDVPESRGLRSPEQRQSSEQPGVVDPSLLSGFARQGRISQADARRQAQVNGLRARLSMIESSRRPMTPVPESVLRQIDNARSALDGLRKSGAIIPNDMDFPRLDPRFQELLDQHEEQLNLVDRAARVGGMEGLREVPRDFFGTDLFDEMSGHLTPQTEQNLESHAVSESRIQDAAALARGERPLIRYSTPPTTFDNDLRQIVDRTGSMRAALEHIRDNSNDMGERAMANRLLEGGAGGTVAMSDAVPPMSHTLNPGESIAGYHFTDRNHTDIYDGGGMAQTLIHEAAHSATQKALRAQTPAAKTIESLFGRAKSIPSEGDTYGLTNTSEFVAEAFSNPKFQQFLKSIPSEGGNLWQRFKDAVKSIFGIKGRSMLDDVMDTTNRLMGENVRQASTNVNQQVMNAGHEFASSADMAGAAMKRSLDERIDARNTKMSMRSRDIAYGISTGDHLAWKLNQLGVKEGPVFMGLQNHRTIRTDLLGAHLVKALSSLEKFPAKGRDAAVKLMQRTIQNIDPRRPWKDHVWLKGDPQENVLQQEHALAQREYDVLQRIPGGKEMFDQLIDANEASRNLKTLYHMHDLQQREYPTEQWKGYATDPIRDYEQNSALQDSPKAARAWAEARSKEMQDSLKVKRVDLDTEIAKLKNQQAANLRKPVHLQMTLEQAQALEEQIRRTTNSRNTISSLNADIDRANARAQQGPYFHLGRDGDHFVTGKLITNNNIPDEKALAAVSKAMEHYGYGHMAVMSRGVNNPTIYVRMEGEAQREGLYRLFRGLQKAGYLDANSDVARGLASDRSIYQTVGPQWMRQAIEALKATPPEIPIGTTPAQKTAMEAAHAEMVREQTRALMTMLPETSITKLYQPRENVQGFNPNMMESYKASAIMNARGLSNMSLSRELGASSNRMNEQLESMNANGAVKGSQLTAASQAIGEIVRRNKLYQTHQPSTLMDGVRRTVHTFQIGASPAYAFTLMSQVPTLTLPELAKTHGFTRSAIALGKAAGKSFNVMRAVWNSEEGFNFGMRQETLQKAGFSQRDIDFLMNLNARGAFNHGAYTEAMTGHQVDGPYGKAMQYANVLGRYSEQYPRVLTALAARDLYDGRVPKGFTGTAEDFAHQAVMNSQFNWNPELNARYTTRSGPFGPMSPLINQFLGFQIRMGEKLYQEIATGFGANRNTEEGRQARTFLLGHAAAVTMLAGTLGTPMVAVAASIFDRLADAWTGKDDWDITAEYRLWLNNMFGKQYGEVIARGVPRLANMDFDHLGEGNLLPGVPGGPITASLLNFATEKRKMEDAEKDWLKHMAGSSVGFIAGLGFAARDFFNGDYMNAGLRMVPEALKGGMEAYRLEKYGWVDKQGFKMNITPSAADVMMTALGIDPAKEAEYNETKKVATGLQQMRQIRSQNITSHLLLSMNRGDMATFRQWQAEGIQFAKDHPGMASPISDFQRAMDMHARNAAVASRLGLPIGVRPNDVVGRRLTSFGNMRNGEQ